MISQMCRAAVSVGSNISGECGRRGNRALLPFLHYAIGSTNALEFQLEVADALGCGSAEQSASLVAPLARTRRMLIRLPEALGKKSS